MPTYTYRREDGSVFEIEQRITAPALTECPTTKQSVTRVITGGSGLVFKGTGFYVTDYARKSGSGGPIKKDDSPSKPSTEKSTTSESTSSKADD